MEQFRKQLHEYNAIHKETDAIYSQLAKRSGLSDCAFWLMYSLRESNDRCTQKDICGQWTMSKQTVNSALKWLEKNGYISLTPDKTDKRSKYIALTEQGELFVRENIDIVFVLEEITLQKMSCSERIAMLDSNRKYLDLFRKEANHFLEKNK